MRIRFFSTVSFCLLSCMTLCLITTTAQDVKVVLTGNTADLKTSGQLFDLISAYCTTHPQPVLWILNGDLFPDTWEEKEINEWLVKANQLLDTYPHLQFLLNQGDRDWDDSGKKGWKKIQALEKNFLRNKHIRF